MLRCDRKCIQNVLDTRHNAGIISIPIQCCNTHVRMPKSFCIHFRSQRNACGQKRYAHSSVYCEPALRLQQITSKREAMIAYNNRCITIHSPQLDDVVEDLDRWCYRQNGQCYRNLLVQLYLGLKIVLNSAESNKDWSMLKHMQRHHS